MAIKKSELYSSLWSGCDALRGGMDASQYKDYVLVLLFVKYISDKYAGTDDGALFVPEGCSFQDLVALKNTKNIGEEIHIRITKLVNENSLAISFADFNDQDKLGKDKEMVERLSRLIGIFQNPSLDFSRNRAEGDDLLGDAYEYLMRHFATESGKSKGQFYTPAEVSRVISKVIGINQATSQEQSIYDPTCGSGSLLLKAVDESPLGLTIFGQEMDNATAGLARMNMILHDHAAAALDIKQGNSLASPLFTNTDGSLKTFDFVVANPPFSTKAWSTGFNPDEDPYDRFTGYGVPPDKNGDYAFLLHIVRSLKSKGKGACILPHGVLFRGNAEAEIRKNLIKQGYIKGIIGLPANLFYGTGIPACIIVLDKEDAESRSGIFMIDASKGFVKDGNKNRLRHQDVHKMVDVFNKQLELPKYSRLVCRAEIERNDYNLNIPRYIDSSEAEDLQDLTAHMLGGIPDRDIEAMSDYWQVFPTLQPELYEAGTRPGYSQMKVEASAIKPTIFAHPEFTAFTATVRVLFAEWQTTHTPGLKNITIGDHPKTLIEELSESILQVFAQVQLIDPYAVYQHLMSYWTETMQDDVYMIAVDGWLAVTEGKPNTDLIPKLLIINRYFAAERDAIEVLEAKRDDISRKMEELDEEQGGEEGLLVEAKNDKGKVTKATISNRLKAIKKDMEAGEERKVLEAYADLIEQEAEANRKVKEAQKALETKVIAQYGKLSVDEIKTLVVDDKWLTTIAAAVQSELDRVSQALTGRIKTLAERYAAPLPALVAEVETLAAKVNEHLARMGVAF